MAEKYQEFRACCSDAAAELGSDAPALRADIAPLLEADASLPVVRMPVAPPSLEICAHELAHVAASLAAGGRCDQVSVADGQFFARTSSENVPWRLRALSLLSGSVAELWMRRTVAPIPPEELGWYLRAVRNCGGGICDSCRAVRVTTVALRHPPDEVVIAEIRRIERAAQEFVTSPRNWYWISKLANILQECGTMTRKEIDEIFPNYKFDISALEQLND